MAARNEGLSITVSERALNILEPTEISLAHEGTSPQRAACSSGSSWPSSESRSSSTGTVWVGATFQLGSTCSPTEASTRASKGSASCPGVLAIT